MSVAPESKNPDSPPQEDDAFPEVNELDELKQVMRGLEVDMEMIENNLRTIDAQAVHDSAKDSHESAESSEIELEDKSNATRTNVTVAMPRRAPLALHRELSMEKKLEESAERQQETPARQHSLPPRAERVFSGRQPDAQSPKPGLTRKKKEDASSKASRRERKLDKRKARAKKKEDQEMKEPRRAPEIATPTSAETESLTFDDLDMENPLPEAPYAPGKDHTGLVLDRRQRRVEAALRAEMQQPDEADWEQPELTEAEVLSPDRRFNLPMHLAKALLVTLAGALVVLGVQTAWKGFKDAEQGDESRAVEENPGLKAIGLDEAQSTMNAYLAATDWKAKLEFVRNPKIAGPRMEQFYARNDDGPVELTRVNNRKYNALEGGEGYLFSCELADGSNIQIPIVKFPDEAPYFVVDWEALVYYADQDWSEFLASRTPGRTGIFRVYAAEDDFYAWQFSDSEQYLGMQVYDTDKSQVAYAYVRLGTDDSREIRVNFALWTKRHEARRGNIGVVAPWLPKLMDWAPMVLELRFPTTPIDGELPQLEVVRFVSSNWVLAQNN